MAAAHAARKSTGPVIPRFNRHFAAQSASTHHHSSSSSFASATTSAFASASPRSFQRHASPTRVNLYNHANPSLSFSIDTPNRVISLSNRAGKPPAGEASPRRTCMCSPTNHPGSFRCSLHKGATGRVSSNVRTGSSSRLILRRSAMKNSLVRIGTVEGDLVKRALAALIRPSSHNQRRRGEFRPMPSRLSVMSKD